ncbi:MAG: hypothetical protein CVT67_09180 [Actinobacteria bacterium HGW-Actinobacteria-7]|nr:MAG: hypothetical protein CVT67_09180 [Actinobacteria bacterium HGW-Actinobacteria-7]
MSQVTARFATSGLHCSSCSMLVDMTLTELDGVVESKTDHATGLSAVVFDDERVSVPQLITAIQSAGYDAELLS